MPVPRHLAAVLIPRDLHNQLKSIAAVKGEKLQDLMKRETEQIVKKLTPRRKTK